MSIVTYWPHYLCTRYNIICRVLWNTSSYWMYYQHRSYSSCKATCCWSSCCLSLSVTLTTLPSHTYLIQSSPAISTCTADYLPASNSIFSVSILLLLFQHHPTRHVSHPTISYCDHTPRPSPTSNIRYDSSLSSAHSVLFKEHTFICIHWYVEKIVTSC